METLIRSQKQLLSLFLSDSIILSMWFIAHKMTTERVEKHLYDFDIVVIIFISITFERKQYTIIVSNCRIKMEFMYNGSNSVLS